MGRRSWLGALLVLLAVLVFALTVTISLGTTDTAYLWRDNMISDLGDSACRVRDGRWICSPNFLLFNGGVILTGVLLTVAGGCLTGPWGPLLAGSMVVMGIGLVITGAFPAGDHGGLHLAGVVLALVVPGLGFLLSGIRPGTPWLCSYRVPRVVLGTVALLFAAKSRLPGGPVPRGAAELIIVAALLLALLLETARLLAAGPGDPDRISRSAGGTGATDSASP